MKKIFMAIIFMSVLQYSTCIGASEKSIIGPDEIVGNYSCSFTINISNEPYTYPPYRCVIKHQGDHFVLEKLSGSQRIKGNIALNSKGFSFEGTFFCPWGECTHNVIGDFEQLKAGIYKGAIYDPNQPDDKTIVDLKKK